MVVAELDGSGQVLPQFEGLERLRSRVAVSDMRRPMQLGQKDRRLHENAETRLSLQSISAAARTRTPG